MKKYSHGGEWDQVHWRAQLRAQLLIEPSQLTVIHLDTDSDIRVQGALVWLTHSALPTDFLLHEGDQMCLPAGRVLISRIGEGEQSAQVSVVPVRRVSLLQRAWLRMHRFWLHLQCRWGYGVCQSTH